MMHEYLKKMGGRFFRLDGKRVVECDTVLQWGRMMERFDRTVRKSRKDGVEVSTVFLGIDHRFVNDGPPLVFETMIFGGEYDGYQIRYPSWGLAVRGHDKICRDLWGRRYQSADDRKRISRRRRSRLRPGYNLR